MIYKFVLFLTLLMGMLHAEEVTYWDTNWNAMTIWKDGNKVSGEYIHDQGIITGTLNNNILRGWWREYGNTKACGPMNEWSGPIAFKFSDDWSSFTGDWGYCSTDPNTLNPDGSGWTGTRRADPYTEAECTNAGRYWCDETCQIQPCGTEITQKQCEEAGKIWCNETCQNQMCEINMVPIYYLLLN